MSDPKTNTYRIHHDWQGDESVSTAVIQGIADVTNTPPTDIGPLYETLDPGALNQLFSPTASGFSRHDGQLSFPLNDCNVTVYAAGTIEITTGEDNDSTTTPVTRSRCDQEYLLNEHTGTVHKSRPGAPAEATCGALRNVPYRYVTPIAIDERQVEEELKRCGRCFAGTGSY